jgi:hypothetical protein
MQYVQLPKPSLLFSNQVEKSKMPSADGGIVAQATKFFENIMKVAATVYSEQPAAFMSGVGMSLFEPHH